MKIFSTIILALVVIYSVYILFKKDTYRGWVYPDGCLSCESKWIKSPEYNTRQACLDWAHMILKVRNNPEDDFECAKNCKINEYDMNVCEETFDF